MNAIARMAAGLSHEANNTTGAIRSNIITLRNQLQEASPCQESLQRIEHATEHLISLFQNIQIYAYPPICSLEEVNLQALADEAIKNTGLNHPGITIQATSGGHKTSLLTCRDMLFRALTGILENACEAYREPQGEVSLELQNGFDRVNWNEGQVFGNIASDNGIMIEVVDRGEGMTREVIPHILEPFFSTRMRRQGLGLSHAAGLVLYCNAALHVVSTPDQGTVFQVLLPTWL